MPLSIIQIAFGIEPLPSQGIGGGNLVYELSRALGELPDTDVSLIDLKSPLHRNLKVNFSFEEVPNHHFTSSSLAVHLFRIFFYTGAVAVRLISINARKAIDIVHAHNQFHAAAAILLKKIFRYRYKTFYTLHNAAVTMPDFALYRILEGYVMRNADHIIALTPTMRDFLIEKYRVNSARISQVHLGIDFAAFNAISGNVTNCEPNRVIYTSTICDRKNQLAVARAMVTVLKHFPDAKCLFYGFVFDQKYFKELLDFINNNGLYGKVIYGGVVQKDVLFSQVAGSAVAVMPSRYEIQPMMLLEALALGLPVVATNAGFNVDVLSHGAECAILVEPDGTDGIARAIETILMDHERRKKMSENAKKLAQKFSWSNIAGQTLDVYLSVQKSPVCPACGCEDSSFLSRPAFKGYILRHCVACNLIFSDPMKAWSNEGYVEFFHDGSAVHGLVPIKDQWRWLAFFEKLSLRSGELLDVGCSYGDFAALAQKHGYSLTGIDVSWELVQIARARLHGKFLVSNIEDLVKGNEGRYDVVTFFEVLEHMADPVSFIRSVFLSLKEGGYAACSVPNRERMRIPMLLFPEREYPPSHLTYWSKDAITKFFENHGFSIVSITEEPLKLLDEMWSFGIIQRCRLDVLAHIFTRGVRPDSELSLEGKSSLKSGFRKKLLMVGAIFYQVVLSTVVGVITIPFRLLLRRSGFSMLIIAKKKAV